MKAITLWQPWAEAMRLGIKINETRNWPTSYRGEIAIHAAVKPMGEVARHVCGLAGIDPNTLHYGKVICVVDLWAVVKTKDFIPETPMEFELGDYTPHRFVWRTRNLRSLTTPVPARGRQSVFNLDPADVEKIMAQLQPNTP